MSKITSNYQTKLYNRGNSPSFGACNIPAKVTDALIWLNKRDTAFQRTIIGSTALFLQPTIDLRNKKVDKKTRETAASRSISRAIVGTITGIAVRLACFKAGDILSDTGKYLYFDGLKHLSKDQMRNYARATGNIMALGVLLFTNFLVDVPLINKISTVINDKFFGNKPADVNANKEAK